MHGTLRIKIITNQNVGNLENAVNTFLTQENLTHENFVDMKIIAVPGANPIGVIVIIYKA